MTYERPPSNAVNVSWGNDDPYIRPAPSAVNVNWADEEGGGGTGVTLTATGSFRRVSFTALVAEVVNLTVTGNFRRMTFVAQAEYDSNVARPTIGRVIAHHQKAAHMNAGRNSAFERTPALPTGFESAFQQAASFLAGIEVDLPKQFAKMQGTQITPYQDASPLRSSALIRAQGANRGARPNQSDRFQGGERRHLRVGFRHQVGDRSVRASRLNRWQVAERLEALRLHTGHQVATPLLRGVQALFEEGVPPPPGLTVYVPVQPPGPTPCYTPNPHLVFSFPQTNSPNLVFQCGYYIKPEPPEPPGNIIVPVQEVYFVTNNIQLRRVSDNALIEAPDMTLRLDVDSWTWDFSATVPAHAQAIVESTSTGPVELKCMVNGTDFRVLAEKVNRERVFGKTMLRVSGRGRNAKLDAPYAPIQTFGNINERTAQQLMGDVLTFNGVPMPWTINWQLTDWLVPAGVFSHQGSYISALGAIAKAAGGFLLPHPNLDSFTVKHLYPKAPWEWNTVTPDFVLPSDVTVREGLEWIEKPEYNRVFVSGQQGGRLGRVTRAGTTGSLPAPMVVDPLITDAQASRQRGIAILSDTGRQLRVDLRLPVLASTGVIQPGAYVRYEDAGVNRLGIVRSTSVDMRFANVWQNLEVETHLL